MNFFVELIERIRTESPKFFIILRYASAVLAALSVLMQKVMADKLWLPIYADKVEIICSYFITAGLTLWGSSFLPNADKKNTEPTSEPIKID